jgi:hypothetical protein
MMELTSENYFSNRANKDYWSVSQFKTFDKCEACGLAELKGEYKRPTTDALLIGSYVDAYFAGEMKSFKYENADRMFKKNGELYAKFEQGDDLIYRISQDKTMMQFLTGEKQVIRTAELFDVPWKIKIDVHGGNRLVDLKTVKDFDDVYQPGFGYRPWVEYWGYDIQGAIYQKIEQIASGRTEPLPFYIVAVTKEKVPDIDVIRLDQSVLDTALALVEAKIERFDMIKHGEVEPKRCGRCDYCKATKVIRAPRLYGVEEE